MRIPQTEYYLLECQRPHLLEGNMPDFQYLHQSDLVPGVVSGVTFRTISIDTPAYLTYLLWRFLAAGGSIHRGTVQHLNQVIEGGTRIFDTKNTSPAIDAIVVCAGLGARFLGGVEDKNMHPIRGQTVLIRAPWVKFGASISGENRSWTYVIPRRSGDVILGGTRVQDDWFPRPRPETTSDILKRCLTMCPDLAPPEIRKVREPTVEDLSSIIVEEGCGLRPGRTGGIRLEVEWFDAIAREGKVPVVYNYGHGGYGYQSSWGSASVALELLNRAVSGPSAG